MSLIRPFRGLLPVPGRAADVLAPPYDVLDRNEARTRARDKPWNFLHISKPEIDLPDSVSPYADMVYARGAENLRNLLAAGVLERSRAACYYVYLMEKGDHSQRGLVATVSVADYDANRIRKHEHTMPAKEADRARQIESLNAQTGPVLLAYPDEAEIDRLLGRCTEADPEIDVSAGDGVRHALWKLDETALLGDLTAAFENMTALYIADGHHRSAAASRVAHSRGGDTAAAHWYFLSVLFPAKSLKILDYNRLVGGLNGASTGTILSKLAAACEIQSVPEAVKPQRSGEFGMYLEGCWHRLRVHADRIPANDPIASLDVSLLTECVLKPVFDIADLRNDERIDFVGGGRGLDELVRRVDSGAANVAFSLFPTSMQQLMAIADAGMVMPPKSTWFEPKLADGLVSHVLD